MAMVRACSKLEAPERRTNSSRKVSLNASSASPSALKVFSSSREQPWQRARRRASRSASRKAQGYVGAHVCVRTARSQAVPVGALNRLTKRIQRDRLRVDTRKWMAARLAPKKYGDRVEHDVRGGGVCLPAILIQISGGEREDDAKLIEGD
jgi:hypothetical protein